jgi:hypothetical protein
VLRLDNSGAWVASQFLRWHQAGDIEDKRGPRHATSVPIASCGNNPPQEGMCWSKGHSRILPDEYRSVN